MSTVHRSELADRPIAQAITARGKELASTDTVGDARRLFANGALRVLPVLDGARYVGALDRGSIHEIADDAPLGLHASALVLTVYEWTSTRHALAALDRDGGTRLVVLGDGLTYVGLVCLRSDRERLCVDAECHSTAAALSAERIKP